MGSLNNISKRLARKYVMRPKLTPIGGFPWYRRMLSRFLFNYSRPLKKGPEKAEAAFAPKDGVFPLDADLKAMAAEGRTP